jgi:hypothetical protein
MPAAAVPEAVPLAVKISKQKEPISRLHQKGIGYFTDAT